MAAVRLRFAEHRFVLHALGRNGSGQASREGGVHGALPARARAFTEDRTLLYYLRRLQHRAPRDRCLQPGAMQQISGFFPHERAWFDRVINELGWVDGFRTVNTQPKQFSWWSNFQNAFERNNGWRIDYQLLTPDLTTAVRTAAIYRDERFSDHAPVVMEYDGSALRI